MSPTKRERLPLIPLPKDQVLLPGCILRIPLSNRPDLRALFPYVVNASASPTQRQPNSGERIKPPDVGCVPVSTPHEVSAGQKRAREKDADEGNHGVRSEVSPQQVNTRNLYHIGTVAVIREFRGKGVEDLALVVQGVRRFRIESISQTKPFLEAKVTYSDEDESQSAPDAEIQALYLKLKTVAREHLQLIRMSTTFLPGTLSPLTPLLARQLELFVSQKEIHEAGKLADFMSSLLHTPTTTKELLEVLAAWDLKVRLEKTIELLSKQVLQLRKIARYSMFNFITGPPSRAIDPKKTGLDIKPRLSLDGVVLGQMPPGFPSRPNEGEGNELDDLKRKLDNAQLSAEAEKVAQRELKRLRRMNPAQAEYQVCRTYLETLSEIPWNKMTEDRLGQNSLEVARKQLDDDHYGLEKIKKRLLEYLAVLKLKQTVNKEAGTPLEKPAGGEAPVQTSQKPEANSSSGNVQIQALMSHSLVNKSPILLLVGPPGTGKTSLAKSVATALGRKFHRISLGGVRDEAEIRGHRRTYVAAMPGLIVNGLRKIGVANPIFLLDEIDKLGMSNFHGDPSAAMLEVLDSEQNHTFTDHYLNIPLDLSRVLFIATANSLDTIPPPLLDRMETISLSGYTTLEKRHIARQHLVPKQIGANGLREELVCFDNEVIDKIITSFTREAGVRNLEREIGAVCRAKAVEYANAKDTSKMETYNPQVTLADLEELLGIEKFIEEIAEKNSRPGIVTGLVAYSTGGNGSILFIEVANMPGRGRVQLTGKLGDVLKESVEVALTWVKAHSYQLGLTSDPSENLMEKRDIHVHCPSGGIPKDGPSAGLAHTIALISLFSGRTVPPTLAMTGEVSLRGRVIAVGGIKEKLIGALRAGVKKVLLPAHNRKDTKDLPQEVKEGLDVIYVS
ncbi:MAG: hypothetical protein M1816_005530 [Peltula sp. TS41687]|nr:MAG: hypothetical protein M1816_005530 [Peltula sp. TS41687]